MEVTWASSEDSGMSGESGDSIIISVSHLSEVFCVMTPSALKALQGVYCSCFATLGHFNLVLIYLDFLVL